MRDDRLTPEQYARAAELFDTACERPEAERLAHVREAAADDPIVLERVLGMLRHDGAGETIPALPVTAWAGPAVDAVAGSPSDPAAPTAGFDPPPSRLAADAILTAPVPDRIDRYRIIDLIGEGGMGRVYRAEQDQPRRTVALKLLRPSMFGPDILRRFRNESEALGRLQHPGIARIHDAGTWESSEGPQPWYAMEFVEGRPLLAHAVAANLDDAARITLAAEIAEAVQHAHDSGIIHRDLKPENVLVATDGQPRILDFGVARVTDSDIRTTTVQTAAGQLIGTLEYMSPEQCSGDPAAIDARTDVYSIGVMLHELMCGRRPHDLGGKSLPEAIHTIREAPIERPSGVNRAVRGDVETIILKALERDPDRRYATAGALAADLRRYLADEPILARPPSAIYQLSKLARRHRAASVAAVLVVLTMVGGTITSTVFAVTASAARDDAELARLRAIEARDEARAATEAAVDARDVARAATAEAVARAESLAAINGFLETTLEEADPWKTGGEVSVVKAVDRAAANVAELFGDEPELEASVRETIGQAYVGLGSHDAARRQIARALKLRTELHGFDAPETLKTRQQMAAAASAEDNLTGDDEEMQQLLDDCHRVLGPNDLVTRRVAMVLASAHQRTGDWQESSTLIEPVIANTDASDPPSMSRAEQDLYAGALIVRAWSRILAGDVDGADENFKAADDFRIAAGWADDPRRVIAINGRAQVAADRRDWKRGEELYRQSLALAERTIGENHPDVAVSLTGLAFMLERLNVRTGEPEAMHRRAIALLSAGRGPDHRHTLVARTNLGTHLAEIGRIDDARVVLNDVIDVRRTAFGPDHPDVATSYKSLGFLNHRAGDMPAAAEAFAEAVEIYGRAYSHHNRDTITAMVNLAATLRNMGEYDRAIPLMDEVLEFDRRTAGDRSPVVADNLWSVARMSIGAGRIDEARAAATEALDIAQEVGQPIRIGRMHVMLGQTELADGEETTARGHFEDAWNVFTDIGDGRAFQVAESLAELAEQMNDVEGAAMWRERATRPEPDG